jgi:hypothetical protein
MNRNAIVMRVTPAWCARRPASRGRDLGLRDSRSGTWIAIAALAALVAANHPGLARAPGSTLVSHDFTDSAEGWRIAGDSAETDPVFHPRGGNPGGYIAGDDEALGETWYFRAPAAVVRQLRSAEHGAISFSLKQSAADAGFPDDDLVIAGTAGRLGHRFAAAPGTDWTDYSVELSERTGWTWNRSAPATQAQIRSVLAAPLRLEIRGEYRTGPDTGSLDSFRLRAAP